MENNYSKVNRPDILVFLSDQHTSYYTSLFTDFIDTPSINQIACEGTVFKNTYTSCPLCVPARMSMLSSLLPSKTGIYTNEDTLPDTCPTFLHPFVEAGYDTVLCGRMHFIGADQRHGFTKRIAPDITPVTWTRPVEKLKEERGILRRTFADAGAVQIVGGGESPVRYFDEMVISKAIEYLSQPHDKPQLIVVGTYGPHFPYIADPKLINKYMDRVAVSPIWNATPDYMNPYMKARQRKTTENVAKACIAAYCALVEEQDRHIGRIKSAFEAFASRQKREHIFCYLSDHGDQLGDRSIWGKDTFFEKSVKIPFMFTGSEIKSNQSVCAATSIMDIGPTLWGMAGIKGFDNIDGQNLSGILKGEKDADKQRIVISELMDNDFGRKPYAYGKMAVQGSKKLFTYYGMETYDAFFDIFKDPYETENLINYK